MNIVFAIIVAFLIAGYAELGLSYYFDGQGLAPTVAGAFCLLFVAILAIYSYAHGYYTCYKEINPHS